MISKDLIIIDLILKKFLLFLTNHLKFKIQTLKQSNWKFIKSFEDHLKIDSKQLQNTGKSVLNMSNKLFNTQSERKSVSLFIRQSSILARIGQFVLIIFFSFLDDFIEFYFCYILKQNVLIWAKQQQKVHKINGQIYFWTHNFWWTFSSKH